MTDKKILLALIQRDDVSVESWKMGFKGEVEIILQIDNKEMIEAMVKVCAKED